MREGERVDARADTNLAEIRHRYLGDIAAISHLRVAMDVGYLLGLIRQLETERSDLLARLHEATTDE